MIHELHRLGLTWSDIATLTANLRAAITRANNDLIHEWRTR